LVDPISEEYIVTPKPYLYLALILFLLFSLLSACAPATTPADAIAAYLEALADNDQATVVANSCAAWEEKALLELASYENVEVTLEDLACQVDSQGEIESTVSCSGKFISSYTAGEDQELDLSELLFSLALENDQWRMCGYIW
jgi:hypothetical protein